MSSEELDFHSTLMIFLIAYIAERIYLGLLLRMSSYYGQTYFPWRWQIGEAIALSPVDVDLPSLEVSTCLH